MFFINSIIFISVSIYKSRKVFVKAGALCVGGGGLTWETVWGEQNRFPETENIVCFPGNPFHINVSIFFISSV